MVRLLITGILAFCTMLVSAQGIDAFAVASANKSSVLVEQPVKVKITAYSSTWFAKPLSFENLQVEGAFVQSFKRTLSAVKYIDKKKYAALEFYFIVFPYREGEMVFPELEITTSIPPEGDYKGQEVTLKTNSITIKVNPIPDNADAEHWLVATNATITNKWGSNLKVLKVGDVLEREIIVKAYSTLPSFIDEPIIGEADFASIYTSEPDYFDERDEKNANGKRIDRYSYLLEEEGTFIIPEVVITWYNPYAGRLYSRRLPQYEINIANNPELESLTNLKDSLNALNPNIIAEYETGSKKLDINSLIIPGIIAVIAIIILWIVVRGAIRLNKKIKKQREEYYHSEAFWYKNAMRQKEGKDFLRGMYAWLDNSNLNVENNSLRNIANENRALEEELDILKKDYYSQEQKRPFNIDLIKKQISIWRKNRLKAKSKKILKNKLAALNP